MILNKQLGYAPIVAAGASGGPPGLVVAAAITVGLEILRHLIHFGSGRKEADAIVPVANALVNPQRAGDLDKIVDAIGQTEDGPALEQIAKDLSWVKTKYATFLSNPDFTDGRAVAQAKADMFPLIDRIMAELLAKIEKLKGNPVIYRLLMRSDGLIASGATYPGCSRDNPAACQPVTFNSETEALDYANHHGEIIAWVNDVEDAWRSVASLMGNPLPQNPLPAPVSVPPPAAQNIAPSATPPPMGGVIGNDTNSGANAVIYRLIMVTPEYEMIANPDANKVNTGATYASCSRSNPGGCQPMGFASVNDAVAYAKAHNETPVLVDTPDDAWNIIEGKKTIQESDILSGGMSPLVMAGIALAAIVVLPKLMKKRG